MPSTQEVERYLSGHGVAVLRFTEPTPTSETAARAVGCTPGEIAKTVLFLVGGVPVAVVTSGDAKVRGSKLKAATGLPGKVLLPDGAEVLRLTGYSPGGVCPFLLPPGLRVVVDSSLRRFARVYPAAGDHHSAVPTTVDQLLALTGGAEADACEPLDRGRPGE